MSTPSDQRPDILMIMPDQMRGDCLSMENHPVLQTPNIDTIGAQGMHFTRAYSTCPSCIPARRAMLTARYPATNGMVGYRMHEEFTQPTFPGQLGSAVIIRLSSGVGCISIRRIGLMAIRIEPRLSPISIRAPLRRLWNINFPILGIPPLGEPIVLARK